MNTRYFKCVRPYSGFTVGKVYFFDRCGFTDDDGIVRHGIKNPCHRPHFIPVKSDDSLENK